MLSPSEPTVRPQPSPPDRSGRHQKSAIAPAGIGVTSIARVVAQQRAHPGIKPLRVTRPSIEWRRRCSGAPVDIFPRRGACAHRSTSGLAKTCLMCDFHGLILACVGLHGPVRGDAGPRSTGSASDGDWCCTLQPDLIQRSRAGINDDADEAFSEPPDVPGIDVSHVVSRPLRGWCVGIR